MLRSDIRLRRVVFASRVEGANKIPLKPQGFNNTIAFVGNNITPTKSEYHLKNLLLMCIMIYGVIILADSILRDRAKEFAKAIVFLCRDMKSNHIEAPLVNQLLRCATSIGANLYEAQYAQSTNDFISKLEIAQKECYETEFWLELLFETDCMAEGDYKVLQNDCGAIRRMLISSLKTVKSK